MPKKKKKKKATTAEGGKKKYKRGSLGNGIYEYFDRVGVDNAKFDDALRVAKKIMPTTKFDKYHFSWYKNKYRELGGKGRKKK